MPLQAWLLARGLIAAVTAIVSKRADGTGLKVHWVPLTSLRARDAAVFVRLARLQDSPGATIIGSRHSSAHYARQPLRENLRVSRQLAVQDPGLIQEQMGCVLH